MTLVVEENSINLRKETEFLKTSTYSPHLLATLGDKLRTEELSLNDCSTHKAFTEMCVNFAKSFVPGPLSSSSDRVLKLLINNRDFQKRRTIAYLIIQ